MALGEIVPGTGAIVQAMSNKVATTEGIQMLVTKKTPLEIIRVLKETSFDPEN